jgi:alpha-D-xyloside xylohydrolase
MLVRQGTAIPHAKLAQSTDWIDWQEIELVVFGSEKTSSAEGSVFLPEDEEVHRLHLEREEDEYELMDDPLQGRVEWKIRTFS